MTRKIWAAIAVFITAVLALAGFAGLGDNYDTRQPIYALVSHFVPKDQHDRAEIYLAAMKRQDLAALKTMTDPSTLDASYYASIPKIAAYLPDARPVSTGAIQYSVRASSDGRRTAVLTINHVYPNGGVVFTTTVFNLANNKIEGFQMRSLSPADLRALRFDPLHASPAQAVLLTAMLAVITFTLVTLYRCLSLPDVRFKWLWFIFITAGIGSLRVNWMTQGFDFTPIYVQWGAAGIYQVLFQPAIVYLGVPAGAAVFWLSGKGKGRPPHSVA